MSQHEASTQLKVPGPVMAKTYGEGTGPSAGEGREARSWVKPSSAVLFFLASCWRWEHTLFICSCPFCLVLDTVASTSA